jgi:hypothetical protein
MPPAHSLRTEGGEGARRHRLRRSIDVGGRRGKTADRGEDNKDDDHHGRSPPPAPPSAEPWLRADDRAGGGGRRHRRQRGRRKRQRGGHVDPAWRQLDLIRRNWEEKRSRRLEEEDGGGGGGAGGGGGDGNNLPRRTAQHLAWRVAQAHYTTIN